MSDSFFLDNSATGSLLGETDAIVGLDLGGMLSVNADARADATLPPLQSVPEPDFTLSGLLVMLPIQL